MKRVLPWLLLTVFTATSSGQTIVPIPVESLANNPPATNTVSAVMGYTGNLVVFTKQFGPGTFNVVTGAYWKDIICCTRCASGGGGRYLAKIGCETYSGISKAFVYRDWIITDNLGGVTNCNTGPLTQVYRITKEQPAFWWGLDLDPRKFRNLIGSRAFFSPTIVDPPGCVVADLLGKTILYGQTCPAVTAYDPHQMTDSQGRVWKVNSIPNGIWTASTAPTPPPVASQTPPPPASPTRTATASVSATQSPTPTPQYVCVTVTPTP
jgi:hypothetical protein